MVRIYVRNVDWFFRFQKAKYNFHANIRFRSIGAACLSINKLFSFTHSMQTFRIIETSDGMMTWRFSKENEILKILVVI